MCDDCEKGRCRALADGLQMLQLSIELTSWVATMSLENTVSMVYSVKQLTAGFCCITEWQRSGLTSAVAPGEQKKLKGLTLNSLLSISLRARCLAALLHIAPHAEGLVQPARSDKQHILTPGEDRLTVSCGAQAPAFRNGESAALFFVWYTCSCTVLYLLSPRTEHPVQ
jgi:hypothetical protein